MLNYPKYKRWGHPLVPKGIYPQSRYLLFMGAVGVEPAMRSSSQCISPVSGFIHPDPYKEYLTDVSGCVIPCLGFLYMHRETSQELFISMMRGQFRVSGLWLRLLAHAVWDRCGYEPFRETHIDSLLSFIAPGLLDVLLPDSFDGYWLEYVLKPNKENLQKTFNKKDVDILKNAGQTGRREVFCWDYQNPSRVRYISCGWDLVFYDNCLKLLENTNGSQI